MIISAKTLEVSNGFIRFLFALLIQFKKKSETFFYQ